MQTIERWFKGPPRHRDAEGPGFLEPGPGRHLCLALACDSNLEFERVDAIVAALFPERVCDCWGACTRLVCFNNHPDTTRDHIDKIQHTYALEHGDG